MADNNCDNLSFCPLGDQLERRNNRDRRITDNSSIINDAKFYTEIEILKRDHIQLKEIFAKLDISVEKIADAATSISKILALHEQRVEMLSDDMTYFREYQKKTVSDLELLEKTISQDNKIRDAKIEKIENHRWFLMGIAGAVGFIMNYIGDIFHAVTK